MKLHHQYLLALSILSTQLPSSFAQAASDQQHLATFFNPRSISRDAARDLVGWANYINKNNDGEKVYGALSITPEWTQTFRSNRITQCLFGNSLINSNCSPYLKISGSEVADRGEQDLLADYFYLPTDFESTVCFKPVIDNFIIDIGWYLGLDAWKKGFYFWLHAPLAHTRWDINITESVINPGVNGYSAGYFAPSAIDRGTLLEQFTDFANGKTLPNIDDITFQELKFAEMSNNRLIKTRVGEIRSGFGWNFYAEDDYHAGFNGQVAFPTGLRPKGEFLFEPMVGNGHFWELGFGANAHYTFWHNQDETKAWMIYGDMNITHLFTTRQARTFDLKSAGPLSRYMLAMEVKQPATNLLGNGTAPSGQFNNDYLPVANATTLNVNVDITIQADIVLMLNYRSGKMSYDFGYNYWGRTGENITLRTIESFAEQTFALKGDARMFGFGRNTTNTVALSATESQATVHTGTNKNTNNTNNNIDFPELATTSTLPSLPLQYAPNNNNPSDQINTSVPPVFMTYNDIDVQGAGSHDSSSKLFAHISYTASTDNDWQPYIGVGGSIEFDHSPKRNCKINNCSSSCGASQWGIWMKTGATFN